MTDDTTATPRSRALTLLTIAVIGVATVALFWLAPSPVSASNTGPCDPARPHASGAFDDTIESGSLTREYVLHIPASYDGSAAVPLIFNLHAFASNPPLQDAWSELPVKGEEEEFIVVTPKGTPVTGGVALHWNAGLLPAPEPDDVAFLSELLTELESQLCINATRVYSTGLSNGAFMSSQLACSIPNRIAAIAPVAGARFFDDCSSVPVPVIAFHGTADPLVSFGPIEGTVIPAWATHNGCAAPTEQNPLPGTVGVRLVRYAGCDDDATVELYVVFDAEPGTLGEQGGGHTWPGSGFFISPGLEAIVGLTTQEISANDLMWDFFVANPASKPASVGGSSTGAELRSLSLESMESSGHGAGVLAAIASAVTACLFVLAGATWWARRQRAS